MQALIDTIRSFNSDSLRVSTGFYDEVRSISINANEQLKQLVQELLIHLNIPLVLWGRYLGAPLTFYELLVELHEYNKKENLKLKAFIALIDQHDYTRWKRIFIGGAIGLAVIEFTIPFLFSAIGITGLPALLATASFVPAVSICYTAAVAAYSIYKNISDKKIPLAQRFRDNFFYLANAALKFAAFGVLIAAATTSSPIAAILFVVAAFVPVIHELVKLVQMNDKNKKKPLFFSTDDLAARQYQVRHESEHQKLRNSVLINLSSAVVYAGIVMAWCFVPGGPIVAIGALLAIGVVNIANLLIHKYLEKRAHTRLLENFEKLESGYVEKQGLQTVEEQVEKSAPIVDATAKHSPREVSDSVSRPSRDGMFAVVKTSAKIDVESCVNSRHCERSEAIHRCS